MAAQNVGIGALAALSGIGGSSGYSNAQDISHSSGYSDNEAWGYGSSASNSYSNMDAWSQSHSFDDSWGSSWDESSSYGYSNSDAYGESGSRTYGREASAQDIWNAAEANKIQNDMWQMQAEYNAKEAQKSREWSKYMQDTYYQRLVDDLRKAGLNPILALSGYGSSAPNGATASSSLASSAKANAYAESESYGYNRSSSKSENWSSSHGGSSYGSHGESSSRSQSTERSRSSSSSSERTGSKGHSENMSGSAGYSESNTNNNIREMVQGGWNVTQKAIGALKESYDRSKYSSSGGHRF